MERVETVVVGAGVVGLAVARALAQAGQEVCVLEQAHAIGTGVSARNSEVIHAGLYYPPGSLKALCCVRGKALLYDFCTSHGVSHRACGKLVVANDLVQIPALQTLQAQAEAQGVPVTLLSAAEAQAMEPALRCVAALWSPTTGIVDSHGLMLALQGDLERAGGVVALASALQRAEPVPGGFELQVVSGEASTALACRRLVNAAGLYACDVARRIEGLAPAWQPQPFFAKGHYFALSGRSPFARLVYPAPQDAWLGVHLTLDLAGQARFGPDLEWLQGPLDPAQIDYAVDPRRADAFYAEVRRYWPSLPDGALQPAYSGVRPKLYGPGQAAPDFRVDGPSDHGVAGLVNMLGIESPGLTSALALAEHVARLLRD
jgi:L-2-hydroxyglutarate oxidase LhgO